MGSGSKEHIIALPINHLVVISDIFQQIEWNKVTISRAGYPLIEIGVSLRLQT